MRQTGQPIRRVKGGKHANVMAAAEELLGESLHVSVHAALVGPRIWRDKGNPHECLRVTTGLVSRFGPGKSDENKQVYGAYLEHQGA